jgi:hypothetical protein
MSPLAPPDRNSTSVNGSLDPAGLGRPPGWRRQRLAAAALVATLGVLALTSQLVPTAAARTDYILMPRSELLAHPTSGKAWNYLVGVAHSGWAAPELDDQNSKTNVEALAAALVYARTGDTAMRAKARHALMAMLPTFDLSQDAGLGPARQIAGWVLVADFIGLGGADDDAFRALLRRALTHPIGTHARWGGSLAACQEDSDNNWGAWCSASRIAAALYLRDSTELARAARVLRGFLGDRSAWSKFRGQGSENGSLTSATRSWSCDATAAVYVPTNPRCGDRSGAFPADAGRSGAYSRLDAMYQSETTAGVILATELLYRNGYPGAWTFRGAIARVIAFDRSHGAWNLGGVQNHWPWLVNRRLGTGYPTVAARYGRSLGYTDWLYGKRSGGGSSGPGTTPRPKQTIRPGPTQDLRTSGERGADTGSAGSSSRNTEGEATASAVASGGSTAPPEPTAAPAAAAAQPRAGAHPEAPGVTMSVLSALQGSIASQLLADVILLGLMAWAVSLSRTTARPGPAQGAPTAPGRRA